jgi:hypothetical protein
VERAELEALAPEVGYEVRMMAHTVVVGAQDFGLPAEVWRVIRFGLLESCLIHIRNVDDFLGHPEPRRDDLTAADYRPGRTPKRFLTDEERDAINGALSHLTRRRSGPNPEWPLAALARRGLDAFQAFLAGLEPTTAALFRDDVAEAEHALAQVMPDGFLRS